MPRKVSKTLLSIMIDMYKKGTPVTEIGEELRIDPSTIHKYLTEEGVRQVPDYVSAQATKRMTEEQVAEMIRLYKDGVEVEKIAESLDTSLDTLYRYIRREKLSRKIPNSVYMKGIRMAETSNKSVIEIAEEIGVSQAGLYRKLAKYRKTGAI